MKARLLNKFAAVGLLVGTAAVLTPAHAAVSTGFAHSDKSGDNGNQ